MNRLDYETPRDLQGFDRGIHECHVMILLPYLSLYHSSVHVYLDLKASRWGGASFQRGECQKGFRAEKKVKKGQKRAKKGGGRGGVGGKRQKGPKKAFS